MRNQRHRTNKRQEARHKINHNIRVSEVRLVGENVPNSGDVVSKEFAQKLAKELDLDLVEINPNTTPSICNIVDYTKFVYEEKKKQKDHNKKQKIKTKGLKEMQFTPNIGDADLDVKQKKIKEFLEKGHKVKLMMKFRGREIANNKDGGEVLLLQIADDLCEICKVDNMPNLNGRNMFMTLSPKTITKKDSNN